MQAAKQRLVKGPTGEYAKWQQQEFNFREQPVASANGLQEDPTPAETTTVPVAMLDEVAMMAECATLLETINYKQARLHGPNAACFEQEYAWLQSIGDQLRAWRAERGLSRAQAVSWLPGWQREQIARLENGLLRRRDLTPAMVQSLRQHLNF